MRVAVVLRGVVLLLLGAALLLPVWRPRSGAAAPLWLRDARAVDARRDSLLVGTSVPAVFRASTDAPTAAELEVLAAAARRVPVYAALPPAPVVVEAIAPVRALSGRAAAVGFRLRADAGDSVLVRLRDETGTLDSLSVRVGPEGIAAGAFRVRPPRDGWREWTVDAGGASAVTGAWVDSAGPPRVLVRAGFPHWESKFVVRALEESGATVETLYDLGRGQQVAGGGGVATPEQLANVDAAVVLDAAPVGDAERRTMADWASAAGGGVLLVGSAGGAAPFGLVAGTVGGRAVDGPSLAWSLPPELAPLPADRVRSAAVLYGEPRPGSFQAASGPGGGVLSLRPLGRGRAAALGITETWRWRMEAGRIPEHREFWRSLVDWLSSAPRSAVTLSVPEPVGARGRPREVVAYSVSPSDAPTTLVLTRPGGGRDTLSVVADRSRGGVLRTSFVPADTGLYTVSLPGASAPSAALWATEVAGTVEDGWARLGVLAGASGGGMLGQDSLRATFARLSPEGGGMPGKVPWLPLVFGALLLAAGGEWLIRRLRGER